MTAGPSIWTRMKHAVLGRPVSHAEQRAAQFRPTRDPMTDAQHQIRSVRYTGLNGGGFSL
jgi:hypothetical protein